MRREVKSVRVVYRDGWQWEYAGSALNHVPPADRIALARELLAGTQRVVAEPIDRRHTTTPVDGYNAGWNAARAAMLGDEG